MRWLSPTLYGGKKKGFLLCLKVNLQDWTHRATSSYATVTGGHCHITTTLEYFSILLFSFFFVWNGALFGGKIYDIANNNVFHAAAESRKSMSGFDSMFTNGTTKSR
ncbi:hypothetical protein CDAR_44851 [Caerostris darwini]|uniref:Uncharacterized protein n=1 Tax=Caerostris darwini TaxID=1538125 RepID=A0AAV4WT52_9ARAC|nr:hypothetical protein CDAR_44851 [Caerostris darwini]